MLSINTIVVALLASVTTILAYPEGRGDENWVVANGWASLCQRDTLEIAASTTGNNTDTSIESLAWYAISFYIILSTVCVLWLATCCILL